MINYFICDTASSILSNGYTFRYPLGKFRLPTLILMRHQLTSVRAKENFLFETVEGITCPRSFECCDLLLFHGSALADIEGIYSIPVNRTGNTEGQSKIEKVKIR